METGQGGQTGVNCDIRATSAGALFIWERA